MPQQYRPVGYESLPIAATAVALTGGVTSALSFVGTLETAQVRSRGDGTDPTSSEGEIINVFSKVVLSESEINNTKFIRTGATSGVLKGHYYSVEATAFSGGGA
jgi:hypothetical protein|tara:strand:+ start:137 stop:448 length:312 start_codon:yes stop_codon:yes gene_type:complete